MKKTILAAAAAFMCLGVNAEVLRITLNNGSSQTFNVDDVEEITFEEDSETSKIAGTYSGTNTVSVGTLATYLTELTYEITANEDGTVNLTTPEYSLSGTVMGDLTLGEYTINNIAYDETRGGFYREYGNDGLSEHFRAVNAQGVATMDKDYAFSVDSNVLIKIENGNVSVTNAFKLGSMPFPITAVFTEK